MKLVKLDGLKAYLGRTRLRPFARRAAEPAPFFNAVPTKLAKGVLFVNAALFTANALVMLAVPGFFHTLTTGGALSTPSAVMEVRAIFGGMALGVAAWFSYCLRGRVREGLRGTLFVYGGILIGRAVGFLFDGPASGYVWLFAAAEAAVFLAAVYVWRAWSAAELRFQTTILAEVADRSVGESQPR